MIDNTTIKREVIRILIDISNKSMEDFDNFSPDEKIFSAGLGLDSLNAVELIFQLEDTFDIEFKDEDIKLDKIDSINAIIRVIRRLIQKWDGL